MVSEEIPNPIHYLGYREISHYITKVTTISDTGLDNVNKFKTSQLSLGYTTDRHRPSTKAILDLEDMPSIRSKNKIVQLFRIITYEARINVFSYVSFAGSIIFET